MKKRTNGRSIAFRQTTIRLRRWVELGLPRQHGKRGLTRAREEDGNMKDAVLRLLLNESGSS